MPRIFFPGAILLALASHSIAGETGDNWPHWRGPGANGHAPKAEPPLNWDEKTNIKWKAPLPGKGSSTPIVWGDQVFVVTAIETDRVADSAELPKVEPQIERKTIAPKNYYQFVVMSFDRGTGKLRWKAVAAEKVPHEGHHASHSYAAGSPTTDGQFLYVSFGSFGAFCYDLNGKLQWQRDLGRLSTRLGWGEAVTGKRAVNQNLLIYSTTPPAHSPGDSCAPGAGENPRRTGRRTRGRAGRRDGASPPDTDPCRGVS